MTSKPEAIMFGETISTLEDQEGALDALKYNTNFEELKLVFSLFFLFVLISLIHFYSLIVKFWKGYSGRIHQILCSFTHN